VTEHEEDTRMTMMNCKPRNQVSNLQRKWCTIWDQVILWNGEVWSIMLCEVTHNLCVWCFYVGRYLPTTCIERENSYSLGEDDTWMVMGWWSWLRSASLGWASWRDHVLQACRPLVQNEHVNTCLKWVLLYWAMGK
jgi:hypothetical protein